LLLLLLLLAKLPILVELNLHTRKRWYVMVQTGGRI